MVVIINGEIVPDDDPRAIARRGSAAGGTAQQQKGARVMSFGDLGSGGGGGGGRARGGPPAAQQPGSESDDVDGLLTPLSKMIGIAGKRVEIPPVPRVSFTGYAFPMVHLVVAALVMLLTGNWRYGILAFIALAIFNPK